jgi:microcystin-dependent protein
MAYEIRFSDFVNKGSIVIEDNTINQETSLNLPGRNTTAYGASIAESFLHLLENFAAPSQPVNPVEGQLWYDNTIGVDQLKLWDGTSWVAAGGLKKANLAPDAANSVIGDLWVDTDNQQLYLFAGSGWVLVGPEFAEGLATGSRPDQIIAVNNQTYDVVFVEVRGAPVAIIASDTFAPKSTIGGFEAGIRPGINLTSANITGDGIAQFNGISEKSLALYIPGVSIATSETVDAANFMRKDAENVTNFGIQIKNNTGVGVGLSNQLRLRIDGQAGVLSHGTTGSNLDIRINNQGQEKTVIRVDSTERVGINNPSPVESLDVGGVIQTDTQLKVTSLTDSAGISGGSIVTSGGVGIAKNLNVGGQSKIDGPLVVGKPNLINPVTNAINPVPAAILPDANNLRTIGQPDRIFSAVYATEFVGSLRGDVQGSVSGRSGFADRLSSPTIFRMTGQVTANNISFDGQQGTVTFNTQIDNAFIANQPSTLNGQPVASEATDEFIVNKPAGVFRMPRSRILAGVKGLTPVGTVIPYAGIINDPTVPIPDGWLVCDGSNYLISLYGELFRYIGYRFKSASQVQAEQGQSGWFAVPDMRGRFPLGADNMGSRGPANRVTNAAADILGASSGSETEQLTVANLPEHEHSLINNNGEGSQFYAISDDPSAVVDDKTIVVADIIGNGTGVLYAGSGGVSTNATLGQPVDIMNPFLTMNYLIYTGVEQ